LRPVCAVHSQLAKRSSRSARKATAWAPCRRRSGP
jgi:hypothetical protein